jgi:hypothetical protein
MMYAALFTFLVAWGIASLVVQRRFRRSVKKIADGVLTMRRLLTQDASYVPRQAADTVTPVVDAMFGATLPQLASQPLTMFGDFMETRPGATPRGPVRWFVDGTQTICGWFAVLEAKKGPLPVITLFSESNAGAFIFTGLGAANPALAHPPSLTRIRMAWTEGIPAAFERHRAEQRRVAPDADAWRTVTNASEATAMLNRLRENTRSWRATQDKRSLIEADARGILGKHFDRIGAAVIQQVTEAAETRT